MADRGVWGTKSALSGVKVGRYQMTLRQELAFLPLSGRHAKITLCSESVIICTRWTLKKVQKTKHRIQLNFKRITNY